MGCVCLYPCMCLQVVHTHTAGRAGIPAPCQCDCDVINVHLCNYASVDAHTGASVVLSKVLLAQKQPPVSQPVTGLQKRGDPAHKGHV